MKMKTTLDLETTGLDPITERLTQIAAIKGDEKFVTYVNPEREIPEFITELTGISNETVKDAPNEKEALTMLLNFLGEDYIIIAQNAPFDLGFIYHALLRNDMIPIVPDFYCTRAMSAVLFPNLSHRLVDMTKLFDIEIKQEHDAFYDAEATQKLFDKLIDIAELHKINFVNKLVEHPDRPMSYKPENAIIIKFKSK